MTAYLDARRYVTAVLLPRDGPDPVVMATRRARVREDLMSLCLLTTPLHVASSVRIAPWPGVDRAQVLSAIDAALRHCAGGDPARLTRRAKLLAKAWLDGNQARRAVLIATARH